PRQAGGADGGPVPGVFEHVSVCARDLRHRVPVASVSVSRHVAEATGTRCRRSRARSEEHTSELQSRFDLVCRLLLEKKKTKVILLRDWNMVSHHSSSSGPVLHPLRRSTPLCRQPPTARSHNTPPITHAHAAQYLSLF